MSGGEGRRRSRGPLLLIGLVLIAALAAGLVLWNYDRLTPAAGTTVVSLTFDDSTSDQDQAVQILDRHGMKGTFFTISGYVDSPGYLSRADLLRIEQDGHEIGGHTVLHNDLTKLDPAEARRQICIDRRNLQSWGLHPTSFAYPYGSQLQPGLAAMVEDCGYSSARNLGNLKSMKGCDPCAPAESLPPADPFQIRTPAGIDPSWTLEDLKAQVTSAQRAGGGWVPLVFHRVCDDCSSIGIKPAVLEGFTDWLRAGADSGIEVRTISGVVGGTNRTTPSVPFGIPPVTPPNPTFALGPDGKPFCWTLAQNGQNDGDLAVYAGVANGGPAMTLAVRNYVDGDAKVLPTMDLGSCAPLAQPDTTYTLGARYRSDAPPQFVLYTRGPTGAWAYWTSGPFMDPSPDDWREATWTTPPTPPGTTGISYGLGLTSNGTVSVAEYGFESHAPPGSAVAAAAAPPEVPVDDGTPIGLWGIVAGVLLLLGLWWLIGGRIARMVARRREPELTEPGLAEKETSTRRP